MKEAHQNQKQRYFRLAIHSELGFAASCSLSFMIEVTSRLLVSLFSGEIRDGELHIGQTTVPVYNPENKTKVPNVLFYENHQVRAIYSWN